MALRSPHGNATRAGNPGPRIEVLPPDELPQPLGGAVQEDARIQVRDRGRFVAGVAGPVQSAGGRARSGRPSLVTSLGISAEFTPSMQAFDNYRRKAASFRRAHTAELAALAGGSCGTGPSSMVASAALQLAASRYLYEQATKGTEVDVAMMREARQQADSSRQNLAMAYELAIREGKARGVGAGGGLPDLDEVTRRAEQEAERRRERRRKPSATLETTGEPA